ncbi:hypothetical protein ZWY2020_049624 [Hordeum vulgare]|nr:hypothetical protein ZWY2020_049624 [Hordeum vulgare]
MKSWHSGPKLDTKETCKAWFGFREIVWEEVMIMFMSIAIRVPITAHAKLELLGNATKLKHQAGLLAEEMHMWALSAGQFQKKINCLYICKSNIEEMLENLARKWYARLIMCCTFCCNALTA